MTETHSGCILICESPQWESLVSSLQHNAEQSTILLEEDLQILRPQFSLILCDDATIQKLNAQWRNKNTATNVLSFPTAPLPAEFAGMQATLGDVYLAFETTMHEAHELGVPPLEHTTHLIIHGLLHLLGFEHQTIAQRIEMEAHETSVLAQFGYENPYYS